MSMQEEGGVPSTMDAVPTMNAVPVEGDLSPPSMDMSRKPSEVKLDIKVKHMDELIDSSSAISHTEAATPADRRTAYGLSNRPDSTPSGSTFTWISKRVSVISVALASRGLSFVVAICTMFGMNSFSVYLPWVFAQGGTLLTSIVLGAVVLETYITASYILEACARAQALHLLSTDGSSMFRQSRRYSMKIRERKYELSLLTTLFLGKKGSLFFSVTTLASMYGIMWAFITIFANSFADKFPLGDMQDGGYKIYIAIFMAIVVPLSCTDIVDQQWIQVSFVVARVVMVILMIGTVAAAYGADEPHFGSQVGPVSDISLAEPSNIVQVTMTCIFACIMQFIVPTMADGCSSKTELSQVFGISATLSYVSNLLLGILLALFFGQDQPDSANLNWVNYHGGTGEADPAAWATAISGYIVLSTAVHFIAQYPLLVLPTGGVIMGAIYGDRVHVVEKDWRIRTAFWLLASIPPAFGALVVSDFSVIAKYTGIFSILSYTVCPALLALRSHACMKEKNLPLTTFYSSYFSSHFWPYGLLLLSAAIIVAVVCEWFV
jgi:hypothetical protein